MVSNLRSVGDPEVYAAAATRVADWLESVAIEAPGGLAWPTEPTVSPETETDLAGAPAAILFFADYYRTTGDKRGLDLATAGVGWLREQLTAIGGTDAPGLFDGLAGYAVMFDALAGAGVDTRTEMQRVFELLLHRATQTRTGVHWGEITEIVWGAAGIGFVLLEIGTRVMGRPALELASRAGDWLLSVAQPARGGLRWDMGEEINRRLARSRDIWYPNFAHGTAGIGAFLARLGAASGDSRYTDAALSAARWVLTTCRTDGGTCAARHHDPSARPGDVNIGPSRQDGDESPMYTMGWCHGPPGLGWFFRDLQLATGDAIWGEWISRTARSVRNSGIPERRAPGFWDNVGRCCGSAGVAEYFLDLHTWRAEPDDLAFAVLMVDDLLDRATVDEAGMRWSNYEFRKTPPELPPETGLYQGASGIGSTLLRLSRHLGGDRTVLRWPCAPDWTAPTAV